MSKKLRMETYQERRRRIRFYLLNGHDEWDAPPAAVAVPVAIAPIVIDLVEDMDVDMDEPVNQPTDTVAVAVAMTGFPPPIISGNNLPSNIVATFPQRSQTGQPTGSLDSKLVQMEQDLAELIDIQNNANNGLVQLDGTQATVNQQLSQKVIEMGKLLGIEEKLKSCIDSVAEEIRELKHRGAVEAITQNTAGTSSSATSSNYVVLDTEN